MKSEAHSAAAAEAARKRRELAPDTFRAFREFSAQVFRPGALPARVKELIAVGVAHVTQCPYCIETHARRARNLGASEEELMEAIWVAAEMRAGGAFAHALIALNTDESGHPASDPALNGETHEAQPGKHDASKGPPLP